MISIRAGVLLAAVTREAEPSGVQVRVFSSFRSPLIHDFTLFSISVTAAMP